MDDFYSPYKTLHEEVIEACDCISANRCSVLGSEIEMVKSTLDRISVSSWDDSASTNFLRNKESCSNKLKTIVNSIASVFVEGENVYNLLNLQLENLKQANQNYQNIYNSEPIKDDYSKKDYYTTTDGVVKYKETYPGYDSAFERWNQALGNVTTECTTCIEAIEEYKNVLSQIDGISISAHGTESFKLSTIPQIYNPKYFAFSATLLAVDSQKEDLISLYASSSSPFYTRFSQGRNSKYGSIPFGPNGKNIHTSGCGVCSFASALSCALTNAYGTNISIDPGKLLESLYALGDGRNKQTYYASGLAYNQYDSSKISRDITEVYRDVSIIEFDWNSNGTMSQANLEAITNAGGTCCVSLKSRGHFVSINGNNGNGKFYISDSGSAAYEGTAISMNTGISGTSGTGYISGKKVWVIIPNSSLSVNGDQVTINGVDASTLPNITAFETAGRAYDVTRNSDGSMTVSGLADNYTYEV